MNKIGALVQLFKWAKKYKTKTYEDSKIDEYTKDTMRILKKTLGKNAPSYNEVRESIQRIGTKINKKDESK